MVGGAAGLLVTVLAGFVASLIVGASGTDDALSLGIVLGAIVGLFAAGYAAARFSHAQPVVHGSFGALVTVVVVGTDALLRGSAATPVTLAGYALLAALLGAAGGWLARRAAR